MSDRCTDCQNRAWNAAGDALLDWEPAGGNEDPDLWVMAREDYASIALGWGQQPCSDLSGAQVIEAASLAAQIPRCGLCAAPVATLTAHPKKDAE